MAEGDSERRVLSRAELAKHMRRQAYQRAKVVREHDREEARAIADEQPGKHLVLVWSAKDSSASE